MNDGNSGQSNSGDVFFDAFYSAGIGGGVIAIFFLVVDVVVHEAFWTPSLLGTVIFTDTAAADASTIRLDMVAIFTVLHFAFFGIMGLIMSLLVNSFNHLADRTVVVAIVAFLLLHAGFTGLDMTLAPGALEAIGYWKVLAGNALTGVGMAYFLLRSHRQSQHDEDLIPTEG